MVLCLNAMHHNRIALRDLSKSSPYQPRHNLEKLQHAQARLLKLPLQDAVQS